ncbi:hypothetical protein Acr_11g0011310 [Actinidia rufa]|uniref:Uncharacterized protein n=1 Tax=Actinidia rufa TaxID=165716 RepID=A0A7J0FDR3_9ERIC|nr:hypothetical protein Acr_11g0011310 [Actinidia rufa]
MFSKTNLGGEESEQSLPSWISDHLGAKSYIDEVSQSPSFPPISTTSPKMDTSSLTKEVNVMSQAELDKKLGSTYSFPSGIRLRIPGDGETILSARPGEVAFYEAAFSGRLKARPEKNLFRGSPSNVKGWKTRFFFASGDEWEFPPGVVASDTTTRVPRSWGTPELQQNCRLCPRLTPRGPEAILGKIEPGGYFEVSKVLGSRTFNKHFAVGCTTLSTSGGDNTTSGDEGEFVTREDSVEYLGVIRRDIGGAIRRALPGIPDETLLRWLGGKVKDPFTNLLSGMSGSSSDSGSVSTSDSELPPELRSDGREGNEDDSQASCQRSRYPREKRTREGDPLIEISEPDASKGKEVVPPPPPKRFKSNRGAINARGRAAEAGTSIPGGDMGSESMSDASVARRLLTGVIPASDMKEVDQLSENELVAKWSCSPRPLPSAARSICMIWTSIWLARIPPELELVKAQNRAVKAENRLAELNEEGSEAGTEAAVIDSAATYFSEGFEFCKRQLLHQYPNLGVDVANMAMDPSFAEEEEARKEGEDPTAGVAPDV